MSKLKPIELECNMGKDVNGVEHRVPWKAYDIDEVDALLAKKDEEIYNIKYSRDEWAKACNQKDKENAELKAKLESVQASMYCDVVDANMEVRRLRRALYKACANWAHFAVAFFSSYATKEKWRKMENKCFKKTEEYK